MIKLDWQSNRKFILIQPFFPIFMCISLSTALTVRLMWSSVIVKGISRPSNSFMSIIFILEMMLFSVFAGTWGKRLPKIWLMSCNPRLLEMRLHSSKGSMEVRKLSSSLSLVRLSSFISLGSGWDNIERFSVTSSILSIANFTTPWSVCSCVELQTCTLLVSVFDVNEQSFHF